MRQQTINLYQFHELSESAKDKAREWYRNTIGYFWGDESLASIQSFCDHFGVKVKSWSASAWDYDYTLSQYDNSNFRGYKLKDFSRDHMPTGYCLDCDLWMTFYDTFKATGDCKHAFEVAVRAGFRSWQKDYESQMEDEYLEEHFSINEYEFTEDGEIVR